MRFFVGMYDLHHAGRVDAAFISAHRLATRVKPFEVNDWIMDSGAFTTILKHGGYPEPPKVYADLIWRWAQNGNLLAAVAQDFMCEPAMLARTGKTIYQHQWMTVERYDELLRHAPAGIHIMPVLQGYNPKDYARHVEMYGNRIAPGAWVGVGSVCKRNGDVAAVEAVLAAIRRHRRDLRLHGFGLKITSLAEASVRDALHSADSMAWSFAARMNGRNPNDWREAKRFAARVQTMPVQLSLGLH